VKVVIRADASLEMGTGHVMRCLTLADALNEKGADVQFVCRNHLGNLNMYIQSKGYRVHVLELLDSISIDASTVRPDEGLHLFHAKWLGVTQQKDAQDCKKILNNIQPDWLIVDHYSIDKLWHVELKGLYQKLMVIDDIADRYHQCDLLLDQTYGRTADDYLHLVPGNCQMLLGSQYALLRPEFSKWREYSLNRRVKPQLKSLLISMGGADPDNITGQVLQYVNTCQVPEGIRIVVVMGETAPHLNAVKLQASTMIHKTSVMVGVSNMAEVMANADLAIGAAGATTWERCCLGVPSLLWVLAVNQKTIAKNLEERNIVCLFNDFDQLCISLNVLCENLSQYSKNAADIADGTGTEKTLREIYG